MELVSRISVTCFAASYGIAMLGEILRIFYTDRWLRWMATTAAAAGLLAQSLFLLSIGLSQHRLPIANQFESLIFVSWLLSLVYIYLLLRDRRLVAGVFILPVSLGLVLFAGTLSDRTHSAAGSRHVLGMAHGMALLIGTVWVVIAFIAAVMYLIKVRQLRSGRASGPLRLPSLERLDTINSVAVYVAWPLLTLGIGLGLSFRQLDWLDPKVVTTGAAWILFTILVHYRYRPENRGRKVALMTIVAFVVVLVSVLGDPLFGTVHQTTEWGG